MIPCPPWCVTAGPPHGFELEDRTTTYVRDHELYADDTTSVEVEERRHPDGTVTFTPPIICNDTFQGGGTTSIAEVRAVAAGLWAAADAAEVMSPTGESREPEVVRAIRRDPALLPEAKVLLLDTYRLLLKVGR